MLATKKRKRLNHARLLFLIDRETITLVGFLAQC